MAQPFSHTLNHNKYEDRRKEKQRQICRGAMKIFRNKGFNVASMREIANASKMSIGNLYNYIQKKEDILFLIHQDVHAQIYDRIDRIVRTYDNSVDQLVNLVKEIYDLTYELKDEMLLIYTETKSLAKNNRKEILRRESNFVSIVETLIEKGKKENIFNVEKSDISANICVFLLAIFPLRGWNILPLRDRQELAEALLKFIMRGLGVPETTINQQIEFSDSNKSMKKSI